MPKNTETYVGCTIKVLPQDQWVAAAATAVNINPANAPAREMFALAAPGPPPAPEHLALMTAKYWGSGGVKVTVGFMDSPTADLRNRILTHMNSWGQWANVTFTLSNVNPQVRIARDPTGYWSYLGTDVLHIAADKATMNLQGFTMNTPDSEFFRVVRHETGHTLGFPHEHRRKAIVDRIDKNKAIAFFQSTQGWSAAMTTEQVLTPIDSSALTQSSLTDVNSIMCYGLPASIMKDSVAVPGGTDIDATDKTFAAQVYPKKVGPSVKKRAPIAVTAWGPNRLDVLGLGTDSSMFHKWWNGSQWSSGWEPQGGKFHSGPAVVAWGANRLDVFGLGVDDGMFHKAWNGSQWSPSWEALGGTFHSPPTVVSWGPNRLDIFGLGTDDAMYHKAWDGSKWSAGWEPLGGTFHSPPAVVSWGPNRLDIFGLGTDDAMYHKAWNGSKWSAGWEPLGGTFHSPPAVASWGPNRLDVFGLGTDDAMYHKAWDGSKWSAGWGGLGGTFHSPPAVVSWGPNRLDIFGLGTDDALYHKSSNGSAWSAGWESLGGTFHSAPAVESWGPNRLDIFGLGTDDAMYHKAWNGSQWSAGWESLGGTFLNL